MKGDFSDRDPADVERPQLTSIVRGASIVLVLVTGVALGFDPNDPLPETIPAFAWLVGGTVGVFGLARLTTRAALSIASLVFLAFAPASAAALAATLASVTVSPTSAPHTRTRTEHTASVPANFALSERVRGSLEVDFGRTYVDEVERAVRPAAMADLVGVADPGDDVGSDPSAAQRWCRDGNRGACYSAGARAERTDDLDTARAMYRAGCELGSGPSCHCAARLSSTTTDRLEFAHAGCEVRHRAACTLEGALLLGEGTEEASAGARAAYATACELGSTFGCGAVGTMEFRGRGGPRSQREGVAHFRIACDDGLPQACADLGHATANGLGTPRDSALALSLFERACTAGLDGACSNAEFLRSVEPADDGPR